MARCHQISRREDEQHLEAESTLVYHKACEGDVIRVSCLRFKSLI